MKRVWLAALIAIVPSFALSAGARAEDPVKIEIIMAYSGQFADPSAQGDNGLKLYLKQHGNKLGGRDVEIIRKDAGGINPPVAKRLAQELITRDNVDILTGFQLTPNALAAADVSAEAKKFMVILNAGTAIITTKSNYIARVSFTLPQLNQTLATWAARRGLKSVYTMVTDYGPGIDAEAAFHKGFKEAGGEIVGLGAYGGAEPGFLRLCATRQGPKPARHFHHDPGRRAAGRLWQGSGRTRPRPADDRGAGPGGTHRRTCAG